jgi:hypothetical protein
LLPLYDIFLHDFQCNISPSGGNNDAIHGGLVNLLYYSYQVFHNGDNYHYRQEIHIMDFIYEELFYALMERNVSPYDPYVMKLIVSEVMDQGDLLELSDIHHFGTLRVDKAHGALEGYAGFGT